MTERTQKKVNPQQIWGKLVKGTGSPRAEPHGHPDPAAEQVAACHRLPGHHQRYAVHLSPAYPPNHSRQFNCAYLLTNINLEQYTFLVTYNLFFKLQTQPLRKRLLSNMNKIQGTERDKYAKGTFSSFHTHMQDCIFPLHLLEMGWCIRDFHATS